MKLRIDKVYNHGDVSKEHVAMTVLEDTSLHWYAVVDSTYSADGTLSNTFRHFIWLPKVEAKAGDRVSLWTKAGKTQRITAKDGTVWHRIFWGAKGAIWNDDGDAAVLIRLRQWRTTLARGD